MIEMKTEVPKIEQICSKCGKRARNIDELQVLFGFWLDENKKLHSYRECKECREKREQAFVEEECRRIHGRAYHVEYRKADDGDSKMAVTCTYLCPYCDKVTMARKDPVTKPEVIESGFFCIYQTCEHCGEIADVLYHPSKRV